MGDAGRIGWVDHAKAVCIIFVVMMHSVLGVEEAAGEAGWMHPVVQFAAPFRMPDFFMISGLFTALVLARPWRLYADRKVLHFAYFYVLWLTIQFALKAPSFAAGLGWWGVLQEYLISFVQPFGTLWFIYLLAVFFVVTKVLHDLKVPWPLTLAVAALLQILPIETGIYIADYFAERFVYFFAGYVFASRLFALADWAAAHRAAAFAGLGLWALVNGLAVFAGYSELPGVSLALGFAGAVAIVLVSSLLAQLSFLDPLRFIGQNSIVIYLAFFFPMAVSRVLLLKAGVLDIGTVSLMVTLVASFSPLLLLWFIRRTGWFTFLIERPGWARIA
ncbi:acyltransferase family protein [Pannonibacter sp. Pt2]|uniref:Acyltransferase family protein n=1 Tax=Pannonibacter anstelovis TaxID=3121537 RepID=A0ABU7ZLR0_9HYPH